MARTLRSSLLALVVLALPFTAHAQDNTGRVSGSVTDDTGAPLIGVNVSLQNTTYGAATDLEGRFTIDAVPTGTYQVAFRYLGYASFIQTDVVVRSGRTATVNVTLQETVLEGEGVTVTAGYFQQSATELTSVVSFSNEEIRRSPGAGQEIVRVINALPGIASRGETSQDIFVRGGSPIENGYYIDNIFIPNAQHFSTGSGSSFGPTGLINTEFVEDIDVFTGGFSAAYGDRLSSISSIAYREGNADGFAGSVGLNFSGGSAIFEGPMAGGRGSWFVSGRRSYLDLIADAIDAGGAPAFSDLQGKATFKPNASNTISVLSLFGQSRFQQTADDAIDAGDNTFIDVQNWQNTTGLTWRSLWAGDGFSVTSISASASNRDLVSRFAEDDVRDLEENVENRYVNLRNVNYASFSQAFKVEFGLDVQHRRSTVGLVRDDYVDPTGAPQAGFDVDRSLDDTGIGAFVSTVTRPLPQLQATLGLRVEGATLNEQVYLSPRIALAYDLTSRLQLSASVGEFRQSVPLYFTSQNAGNTSLDQMRARHAIAGISYLLTPDTRLSVEVYDKQYTDMPQIASTNTLADPTFVLDGRGDFSGALTSDGEATARGFDILLQKKMAQNLYGLASVSFFRAQYTDPSGQERPRTFDTQTLFTVIGGYKPNDKWEVSARWSYSGGRPVTPLDPIASAAQGDEVFDVSQFHGERLPAYHSLFLRVDRRYNFAQTNLVAFFSLWNAYNRANVEERFWNATDERIDDANLFSLLPVAGVVFEF